MRFGLFMTFALMGFTSVACTKGSIPSAHRVEPQTADSPSKVYVGTAPLQPLPTIPAQASTAPALLDDPVTIPNNADRQWSSVVVRVEVLFRDQGIMSRGTGFIIKDRSGDHYLLTCAHVMEVNNQRNGYRVLMKTMNGRQAIESVGWPVHLGKGVDLKHPGPDGQSDMTQDFVIRLVTGDLGKPLPLAAADPAVGDPVWAVGCEANQPPGDEHLYLGQVLDVAHGGYVVAKQDSFNPQGFSGGPMVNSRGEVVGNVLAGNNNIITGATITTIRQRLREEGIVVN